jgi:glyoxylase-like metal-dependent hydrolase (beta-lactamase superfamily II)
MVEAYGVAPNIYLIDAQMYSIPKFTSVYLIAEEKMALIETASAASAGIILDGIRQLGFDPKEISYIIVTHIHLDHAGGAGVLLKDMPQAKVIVHERGAKHLIDPSRLINSARSALGEEAVAMYGLPVPIDQSRVLPVKGGEVIELSKKQKLKIIHAPGHAPYHVCIYEDRNKGLFTGDAVGMYYPDGEILTITTPLPDFALDTCIDTINMLMSLSPQILFFSHFGTTKKVRQTLQQGIDELNTCGDIIFNAMKQNAPFESIVEKLSPHFSEKLKAVREKAPTYYQCIVEFIPACVMGYINYYQKKGVR